MARTKKEEKENAIQVDIATSDTELSNEMDPVK